MGVHQKLFLVFTNCEYQYIVFMGTNASFLLGKYLGVELLMFNLRRKCKAVFQKGCTAFPFYLECSLLFTNMAVVCL